MNETSPQIDDWSLINSWGPRSFGEHIKISVEA